MKKIFAILMVVSVLGMMVGCGPKEEAAAETTGGATAGAATAGAADAK